MAKKEKEVFEPTFETEPMVVPDEVLEVEPDVEKELVVDPLELVKETFFPEVEDTEKYTFKKREDGEYNIFDKSGTLLVVGASEETVKAYSQE